MPEKTNSAKRHPSIAQTLDRFLERVRDEPEHAAHFTQEIPEDPSDLLERNNWRRDQNFFGRVLFLLSHCRREAALIQETEKAKIRDAQKHRRVAPRLIRDRNIKLGVTLPTLL